ncbi:MAG: hypothetical protein Q8P42_06110 [Gallionella sp.]|nr:hypothetical protein [Gallionella sp.]
MSKIVPKIYAVDDIPTDILASIGKIIAWWGYLQFQLGVIIRIATKLSRGTGNVLTIGADLSSLCRIITTLADSDHWIKDENIRKDLAKFADDVRRKSTRRNDYAHGVFGFSDDDQNVLVRHLFKQSQHKVTPGIEKLTQHDLQIVIDEARDLWNRAQDLTHRLKSLR